MERYIIMVTVYKYVINPSQEEIVIKVPRGIRPFSVGLDPAGAPCFWAFVDTDAEEVEMNFYCIGTGWPADWILEKESNVQAIGSIKEGPYMWHVLMGGER